MTDLDRDDLAAARPPSLEGQTGASDEPTVDTQQATAASASGTVNMANTASYGEQPAQVSPEAPAAGNAVPSPMRPAGPQAGQINGSPAGQTTPSAGQPYYGPGGAGGYGAPMGGGYPNSGAQGYGGRPGAQYPTGGYAAPPSTGRPYTGQPGGYVPPQGGRPGYPTTNRTPQMTGGAPQGAGPTGYTPGAWQLPPQVLTAAGAQTAPNKSHKYWGRFTAGCKRLWKQLVSSLVVRIVCNGAVSALAGLVATAIIGAILNVGSGVAFLFFTAVTLLIFIKMTNHTMSYIKNIAEAVGKISSGDYSVKVPEKYSDELGTLARQINQMTVELSRAREREQLEEQRKNEFITSIAHDLRTPLTSVIGYLGLISEQDGQPVDKETLVRYADVAFRKSKRLEQLITQLFDFSRYNFGEIRPAENRIDLAELIEQINQEFYPQFTERHLESRVIISGRPVIVKGDGGMLARVFDNILGNAVRYGASGRYIDIELYNRGTEAVIRVTNYGAEITPEDLTRIFDKFYRTDASRSSETGGAGLGMAIAKNIVEAHGGQIRAMSGDGRVTFEVVLPVIAQQ